MAAQMLLLTCVGVLVPALALAQDSSSQVLTLLRSNTPIAMAWGAFEAGTLQITEAVPAMVTALESLPPGSQLERDYVAAALLDALIQIRPVPGVPPGPQAPASVVAPYLDRWPIQTLILLGRSGPEGDRILLDLFRSLPPTKSVAAFTPADIWFALANLLVPRAPSGFAASLLQGVHVELLVTVSETGETGIEMGFAGGGGDGIGQKPSGFPPHAVYGWDSQRAGTSVLSTGPRTLYYLRSVTADFQFPTAHPLNSLPTVKDRLAYLSAIAGGSYRSTLDARMGLGVKWTNGAAYRTSVAEKRREIQREYAGLIARLVNNGRLSADEAARLPLGLKTVIRDERSDRSRPLPQIMLD
jgi:hypothetical protein